MKSNHKDFGAVEIIVIILIIGLLGVIGWLVYDRLQNKSEGTTTQVETVNNIDSPSQTTEEVDPNKGYLVVKDWNLRFKIPTGLSDVRYTIHDDTASFFAKPTGSSVEIRSDYDTYKNGHSIYALGTLIRSNESTMKLHNGDTRQGKKVGDYYYYTSWSFSDTAAGIACLGTYGFEASNCAAEAEVFKLINKDDNSLLRTIEVAQ